MATTVQRALNAARKKKKEYCAGKVNKTAVKASIANYIKAAEASAEKKIKDPTKLKARKAEIKKIGARIAQGGCKMSSSINGTKKRKTTKKRTYKKRK